MLVSEKHKRLILNLKDPGRIKSLIPGTLDMPYKGANLTVVPHTHDATLVLRSVGLNAPSPIRHYYTWPGRVPYMHQTETAAFLTLNRRAYCLNGMGSGKTLSTLWAFDWLRQCNQVSGLIVISPLSTLSRAWGDEIFINFPHLNFATLHGDRKRRSALMKQGADVFLVNHDGVRSKDVLDFLCGLPEDWLVVVDELAVFRNSMTERWKSLNKLINGHPKSGVKAKKWAWGLTGTPLPNEPTDAYAQCRLITPTTVPRAFGAFREQVMYKASQFVWLPKEDAVPTARKAMNPSIRFRREDCIDLPPTTYVDRDVPMEPEQARMYSEMLSRMRTENSEGRLSAINKAVLTQKLLQIAAGVAYNEDGEITIPAQRRLDEVLDCVMNSESKTIVFAPFTGALRRIADYINERYPTALVTGETPRAARDTIFADFQRRRAPQVIVANPGTMAHGLTLTAASTIVWFGPTSSEIYQQANMRIVRPGQKHNTLIVRLVGSAAERKAYDRLDGRGATQDLFLDIVGDQSDL